MTEQEILELRGDNLDIAVAKELGWHRYKEDSEWWIEPDDETFHLIPAIDNWNFFDQRSGSDEVDFNPSKKINQAFYLGEDEKDWIWVFTEQNGKLSITITTESKKVSLSLCVNEFGYEERAELFSTGRCLAWLLMKEQTR